MIHSPPNVTSAAWNAAYWLEVFGFVDVVGGAFLDRRSRRNVCLQVAVLDQATIDWTKKRHYQWLTRNWELLSLVRLPRAKMLLRILQYGPGSAQPNDRLLRDAFEQDAKLRRRRYDRSRKHWQLRHYIPTPKPSLTYH